MRPQDGVFSSESDGLRFARRLQVHEYIDVGIDVVSILQHAAGKPDVECKLRKVAKDRSLIAGATRELSATKVRIPTA